MELSIFDAMLNLLTYTGTLWLTKGTLPRPLGSAHEYTVPWQAFEAKDGYVVVGTHTQEGFWRKLCEVIEEPELADDPSFTTNAKRVENRATLIPRFEQIFRTRTVADWLKLLRAAEVPAAPVNNLDRAFSEPPVAEREMIVEYEHPDVGKVRLPGNPIKTSTISTAISNPAPRFGEHTDAILSQWLGLKTDQIASLRAKNVIN